MSLVPDSRPRASRANILERLQDANYTPNENVFVVAIRGYYYDDHSDNKRAIYDDAMFVFGSETFAAFNANTDPSVFRKGIASLVPGVHRYRPGKHKISSPSGYPAFRPATKDEELPVTRDGIVNPTPGVAINIHRGSMNGTSSLGCQTIPPSQWSAFQKLLMLELKKSGQDSFNYYLLD
jgi:lysozyme